MALSRKYLFPGPDPFLNLQRNAILRSFPDYDRVSHESDRPHLYKKPSEICMTTDEGLPKLWRNPFNFSKDWRARIADYLYSFQLNIRSIEDDDTPQVQEFFSRRYSPVMASEICAFDLFRIRNYGHGLLLEDRSGTVQGTIFEMGYDTQEKTSYTIRLAIAEELAGKNLGMHLMQYSCLLAMEQGSRVKRGIIQYNNLASLHINLNKVGWICDKFEPHINGLGAFFHIALPLDPAGLTSNTLDFDRVATFLKKEQAGSAYQLLPCEDLNSIEKMYRDTDFKVVALLKPGMAMEGPCFLAIPADRMRLEVL